MSLTPLDNLVRIGQLKAEPRNDAEIRRMLNMAHIRLQDALLPSLSLEGRFTSAYNAAHGGTSLARADEILVTELCQLASQVLRDAERLSVSSP